MSLLPFILDSFSMAVKVLGERKLRSALTVAGIVIGPLIMVMMGSIVGGYTGYIVNEIQALGQNVVVIFPSGTYDLTGEDLEFVRSLDYVDSAEPFYAMQGVARRCGADVQVSIYAINPSVLFKAMGNLKIERGEVPPEGDLLGAIVGRRVISEGDQLCLDVGDVVTLYVAEVEGGRLRSVRSASFVVAAVLEEYGGAFFLSPDQMVVVNTEAGRTLLNAKKWSGIFVVLRGSEYVRDFVRSLRRAYGGNVEIVSFLAIADAVSSVASAVSFVNYVTSLSAFAVAVAGVSATMVTSVIERTKEIGVMKAVGFTNGQVVIMVLSEALVMCFIGASVGISLGVLGAHILSTQGLVIRTGAQSLTILARPDITPQLLAKTFGLTVLVGLAGGFLPAYMAAKVPPAVALRYE